MEASAPKHSICGYSWGDLGGALSKCIATGNMQRAQRWAAEFICSETGLGRLEALLFHTWALHVGTQQAPGWPLLWLKNSKHIRDLWAKSGGDIRTVRNTPSVRQSVAEAVAWLVLVPKKTLPALPKSEDCFRESEAMRARLRNGGGAGDQAATRRVWAENSDGHDLKTIGNEFEAALRGNQQARMLFWIIWLCTLDTQKECPNVKERAPVHVTGKQRKSVLWFLGALIEDLMREIRICETPDIQAIFELLGQTWMKLAPRGRRDVLASLAVGLQERSAKPLTFAPPPPMPQAGIRSAMADIDGIYAEIATEAKKFIAETPQITGLTAEAAAAAAEAARLASLKRSIPTSMDKLAIAYTVVPGMQTGMQTR
jgi:hypothetical protein